jgi:hypothetical protein
MPEELKFQFYLILISHMAISNHIGQHNYNLCPFLTYNLYFTYLYLYIYILKQLTKIPRHSNETELKFF